MRGNGICICQQHEITNEMSRSVDISIFILHYRAKFDLSINIQGIEPSSFNNIRVCFDTIADMLLVFIPGHHFQLIDCSEDHGPSSGITLSGSNFAPWLPDSQNNTFIVPIDVLNRSDNMGSPDLRGNIF